MDQGRRVRSQTVMGSRSLAKCRSIFSVNPELTHLPCFLQSCAVTVFSNTVCLFFYFGFVLGFWEVGEKTKSLGAEGKDLQGVKGVGAGHGGRYKKTKEQVVRESKG